MVTERVAGRDYHPDGTVAREWAADRYISPPRYPPHVTWHTYGEIGHTALPRQERSAWRKAGAAIVDCLYMLPTVVLFAGATWAGARMAGLAGAITAAVICTLLLAWVAADS